MRALYMSDEEITRNYQNAADKKAQVAILADLNAVDRRVMQNKLIELGLMPGEIVPEKKRGAADRIDEGFARLLIEKDVPDKEIAAHFGVGVTTFQDWRRSKGIMRYPAKKRNRKTVKEFQGIDIPIIDMKQKTETPTQEAAPVTETPVTVAADENGLTVAKLGNLFATLNKLREGVRVTVGGKTINSVMVNLRFDGQSGDVPADMSVELVT